MTVISLLIFLLDWFLIIVIAGVLCFLLCFLCYIVCLIPDAMLGMLVFNANYASKCLQTFSRYSIWTYRGISMLPKHPTWGLILLYNVTHLPPIKRVSILKKNPDVLYYKDKNAQCYCCGDMFKLRQNIHHRVLTVSPWKSSGSRRSQFIVTCKGLHNRHKDHPVPLDRVTHCYIMRLTPYCFGALYDFTLRQQIWEWKCRAFCQRQFDKIIKLLRLPSLFQGQTPVLLPLPHQEVLSSDNIDDYRYLAGCSDCI